MSEPFCDRWYINAGFDATSGKQVSQIVVREMKQTQFFAGAFERAIELLNLGHWIVQKLLLAMFGFQAFEYLHEKHCQQGWGESTGPGSAGVVLDSASKSGSFEAETTLRDCHALFDDIKLYKAETFVHD